MSSNMPFNNRPRSAASAGTKCVCCTETLKKNKAHNIFDEYGRFRQIQFLLAECVQKSIVEVPGSRQAICTDCLNQLEQNYAFKLKCTSRTPADNDNSDEELEADADVSDVHEDENEMLLDYDADENATVSEAVISSEGPECAIIAKDEPDQLSRPSNVILETDEPLSLNKIEYCDDEQIPDELIHEEQIHEEQINEEQIPDEQILEEQILEQIHYDQTHYISDYGLVIENDLDTTEESAPVADVIEYELSQQSGLQPAVDDAAMPAVEYTEQPEVFMESTSFIESLTVHSIKEIIRAGIPVHTVGSTNLLDEQDPVLAIESSDQADPLPQAKEDEEHPIDLDDYVMSIVSVSFCEYSPLLGRPKCGLCETSVELGNYSSLMQHIAQEHNVGGEYNCCLDGCGALCSDYDGLNNHMFVNHSDVLKVCCFLTCQTCDLVTESLVKFGKHVCTGPKSSIKTEAAAPAAAASSAVDNKYTCGQCQLQLSSHRRFTFHQQFHCSNARPKVCLICDRLFANEHRFYEHVQFAHDQFAQHFCRHCDKSFTLAAELLRHEHAHTAVRSHVCPDCGKAFFDTATLFAHSALHQNGYTCDLCSKRFNRKFRLRKHMALHVNHEPAVLPVCERCGRIFVTETAAHDHWNAVHEGFDDVDGDAVTAGPMVANVYVEHAFCCEYCEAAYDQVTLLLAHKATHDEQPAEGIADGKNPTNITPDGEAPLMFQCAHCPRRFAQYARLRSHASAHPEAQRPYPVKRMYVCELDDCRKPYADWNNYQSHRKTVHLVNPSIIRCTQCDEVFYKSWLYAYHKKSVHQAHKQCPLCPQTFVIQRGLDEHVARVHVDQPEEDEPRTDASKVSSAASGGGVKRVRRPGTPKVGDDTVVEVLEDIHYSAIANGDGFRCLECGKIAIRRSNAVSHVRMVHMKIRNFSCAQCSRTFYHRGDLNDHMKMHFAITPFQCPYCQHKVRTASMLKVHIRSHTNERPYQCTECPKAFKRSMVLKNHMKLHAGVKEFGCEICAKTFFTKYSLSTHLKKKHWNGQEESSTVEVPKKTRTKSVKKTSPSIIIVMPGPPDKKNGQSGSSADSERKSQNVIVLP